MAKTQFNTDKIKTEAVKPLFAAAGATELAVEYARGYATEATKATQAQIDAAQTRVKATQARASKVDFDTKKVQADAKARVEKLQADAKDAQAKFEAKLNEALKDLNTTYADLAERGEKFVAAVRKDGVKAVTAVKPAKKTAAKKAPAKKAPAKKAAAKKAPAKKAPAKKAAKKAS